MYPESTNSDVTITVTWQHNFPKGDDPYNGSTTAAEVEVSGAADAIYDSVQALAWLAGALRFPTDERLSLSEVTLHHLRNERSDHIHFDLRLSDLRRVTSQHPLCWHKLFGETVVVSGFPIRARDKDDEAIGLEITAPMMITLAGTVCEAAYEKGLILRGLSTTLIPTKTVESGCAIQWHLFSDDDNLLLSKQIDCFPQWVQTDSIFQLCQKRAFLGWCNPATVILGMSQVDYGNIDFSEWQKSLTYKRITLLSFDLSVNLLGHGGPNTSAQISVGRRQRGHYWNVPKDLRERSCDAQVNPVLQHDQEDKRAWLVPLASTLLHMVHLLC